MKTLPLVAGLLPLVLLPASHAATLFQDTFDRPDSRDIQAVATGITDGTGSGLGAGNTYTQPFLDPANRSPTFGTQDGDAANGGGAQILGNNLQLAVGAGTSNLFVNHNFTDPSIVTAGGFSVSLDVLAYSQATNGQGAGFAVGMISAEAASTLDSYSGALRMTGGFGTAIGAAVPANNVSDFWVVIRGDNTLVWGGKSGNVIGATALPAKTASLGVNFRLSSFAAGSTVTYEVIADGVLKGTGSFTWSDANANYIGIDSRDASSVSYDNFRITTDFLQPQVFPPEVDTFEVTRLTGGTKDTRFHWSVLPGTVGDPVTVTILSGSTVLATSNSVTGYADVSTSATNFTLKAANTAGNVTAAGKVATVNALATAIRTDSPALWYSFNGSGAATLVADGSNAAAPHDGAAANGLFYDTGALDGAAFFNGTNSSVVTSEAVFNPATPAAGFTVEAVVRRYPGSPADAAILSQIDGTGTGRSYLSVNGDGTIETFLAGGPAQKKTADVKLPADTWAHLVMVVDKLTPEIRWYLDGVQIGSTSDGANPDGSTFTSGFTIEAATGAWRIGTQKLANQNFWLGDIDEVAVYASLLDDPDANGNRSDSRVPAHASAWYSSASGLLGFYAASDTISAGSSTTLTVKVGANVTSVTVDNGVGIVTPVNGVATITVHPTETTTYTITTTSPAGTQSQFATVAVTPAAQAPVITSASITGGNFVIAFTGSPSTAYNVRGSLDLATFGIDLGTAVTNATGVGSASVPLTAGRVRQFYRIETQP